MASRISLFAVAILLFIATARYAQGPAQAEESDAKVADGYKPMPRFSEARAAVEAKLDKKVDVAIGPQGLILALDALEKQGGVKVTVDLARMRKKGVTQNVRVKHASRGKPLRESFDQVLKAVGLDYEVTDEGVLIPASEPVKK